MRVSVSFALPVLGKHLTEFLDFFVGFLIKLYNQRKKIVLNFAKKKKKPSKIVSYKISYTMGTLIHSPEALRLNLKYLSVHREKGWQCPGVATEFRR